MRLEVGTPNTACNGAAPLTAGCTNVAPSWFNCGAANDFTGIGLCAATLSTSFFANNGRAMLTVSVRYEGVEAASAPVPSPLELHGYPPWHAQMSSLLPQDGMFVAMPFSPKYAGELMTVHVYARATTYALVTWGLTLEIDTSLLTFESGTGSSYFNPAVINTAAGGSPIGVVAVGIKSTTSTAQVTGGAVLVFTANLRIASSASAGVYASALRVHVNEMINQGSLTWVTNQEALVLNAAAHPSLHGESPAPRGLRS